MSPEPSGKPDAWKLARPVWGWGRGAIPRPTPHAMPDLHAKNEAASARPGAGRLMSIYTTEYGDRLVVDTVYGEPGEPIATTVSLLSENEFPKSDAEGRHDEGRR